MKFERLALLLEMPQYYPSTDGMVYMSAEKFIPISRQNLATYTVLAHRDGFIFVVHPDNHDGFVFDERDLQTGANPLIPVLRVSLRDTPLGYKQAHFLRIRKEYARQNIATTFYSAYVEKFGGIVSDTEHLDGGKVLWKALIKSAQEKGRVTKLVDLATGNVLIPSVTESTPEDAVWSNDASHKNHVLIYFLK